MDSVLNKLVKMCCDKNLQTWFAVLKNEHIVACSLGETTGQELRFNNLSFPHRFVKSAAEHLHASDHFAVALLCVLVQESKWTEWMLS